MKMKNCSDVIEDKITGLLNPIVGPVGSLGVFTEAFPMGRV